MQRLEVSGAVRPIYGSLGVKRLTCCPPEDGNRIHRRKVVVVIQTVNVVGKFQKIKCVNFVPHFVKQISAPFITTCSHFEKKIGYVIHGYWPTHEPNNILSIHKFVTQSMTWSIEQARSTA